MALPDQLHHVGAIEGVAGIARAIDQQVRQVLTELSCGKHVETDT
jgi:hypothetical protein